MDELIERLELVRFGPAEATVGMVSLPLPRQCAGELRPDHELWGMQPVGWWERGRLPRRALTFVVDDAGTPEKLRLTRGHNPLEPCRAWQVETRITREELGFVAHRFDHLSDLRGVPAADCTTIEFELLLSYGGRTLGLQFGASGPKGGPYWWQNVQVDRLWANAAAQAVRIGGVIYNEDTYLWADVFLLLFANGVAHVAAHFVNTKLHIEGYNFRGLPVIRFAGDQPALNLADSAHLSSDEFPSRLESAEDARFWWPIARTFNPQLPEAPETEWAPGMARTFRFQLSLSEAHPAIARYVVPSWWYAVAGEPWPWGYLPVRGPFARLSEGTTDFIRELMTRGRFDAGSASPGRNRGAALGDDGDAGWGMMQNYYQTGRPELFEDALNYCHYWADMAVDHSDFSVHQSVGGWGWKTCAYSKFRDVFYAYLETADPHLLDTTEMAAASYWAWFRANWPRCTIGRDAFEVGAWALLWRFLRTEHARERTLEFVRMIEVVLESRGEIGGQMGAGPHPGYHSSLYMTGVAMMSLLDVAEAAVEEDDEATVARIAGLLHILDRRYQRDDVEVFPSNLGQGRTEWRPGSYGVWVVMAGRAYTELARLQNAEDAVTEFGLRRCVTSPVPGPAVWPHSGRLGNQLVHPIYHDAMLLGARLAGPGVELAPLGEPELWPEEQVVKTPFGDLTVRVKDASMSFEAAESFPVTVLYRGRKCETNSRGTCDVG